MTTDALIIKGDCLNVMAGLPDGSIDAIVTDPPYGLGFLGKNWDHSVPGEAFWREALRVAKPGCHLLAAGGTRTYHRLACAIEDAGWEIRDCVMWLYGSGFPKSHDVSKAIDKMDASEEQERRRLRFTAWVRSTGVTSRQIDEATGTNMGGHYTTAASQPAVMTREHLESCRHLLGDVPDWVEREADIRSVESRNMAKRDVVGKSDNGQGRGWAEAGLAGYKAEFNITAPATPEAKQWSGWGTALKPAYEPFILARKPLDGTVAENVLKHGTGGINVDGCRIAHNGEKLSGGGAQNDHNGWGKSLCGKTDSARSEVLGRWPANIIHDGSDEVVAGFEGTEKYNRPSNAPRFKQSAHRTAQHLSGLGTAITFSFDDRGSAARFFYCPKADRAEREEGLNGLKKKAAGEMQGSQDGSLEGEPMRSANHHPTVKPVTLMAYLCRLITPPGGLILDPFCGSGSTGVAAMREGFNFVGIELNPEYAEIAKRRIEHERNKTPLFSEVI